MNELESLNRALFLRINGPSESPSWIADIAIVLGDYLIYLIPVLLLGLWQSGNEARRNLAIKACVIALLGVTMNQIIPLFWQHPRPFMIGLGHTWISHSADSSFPSDHLTVVAGVGLTMLADGAWRIGLATLAGGLCIAWARVFLGVHFPLDMLGSVGVAACSCVVVSLLWRRAGTTTTEWAIRLYRALFARPIAAGWLKR